jgi:hypothetical protein
MPSPARGLICKLDALPCPRPGLCGRTLPAGLGASSPGALAAPTVTMEMLRRWLWPRLSLDLGGCGGSCGHCDEPERPREKAAGALSESEGRWPREGPVAAANVVGGVRPTVGLTRWRVFFAAAALWLASGAVFLKVIVHLISSPAKTVCSSHRMKTRTLPVAAAEAMVGRRPSATEAPCRCGRVGSVSYEAVALPSVVIVARSGSIDGMTWAEVWCTRGRASVMLSCPLVTLGGQRGRGQRPPLTEASDPDGSRLVPLTGLQW